MRAARSAFPIVVFDFDGVACDSTDECMVTSWNAWERWNGRDGFRQSVAEVSDEERRAFRAARPRVRGAGEYYVVRRALSEGISIADQASYDQLVLAWSEHHDAFKKLFFEMRDELRSRDLSAWIDLHPVYREVIDVMVRLRLEDRLYVATLKDGESVRLILSRHGLQLPEERLLDQSQITSKVDALNTIRARAGCAKSEILFIDDNVTHLREPQMEGYPILMTTWGPMLEEYLAVARENSIPLLTIADVQNIDQWTSAQLCTSARE